MKKQVCPKCKSKKVINKITLMSSLLAFHPKNKCLKCGFESYILCKKAIRKGKK